MRRERPFSCIRFEWMRARRGTRTAVLMRSLRSSGSPAMRSASGKTRRVLFLLTMALLLAACGNRGADDPRSQSAGSPTPSAVQQEKPECASAVDPGSAGGKARRSKAKELSIAGFLSSDERFGVFRQIAEEASAMSGRTTWLKVWDWPASHMGNDRNGVTVFVPTDEAFALLESDILESIADGSVDAYELLGHHYVHKLYPSSDFEPGPQTSWRGGGEVELTLEPPTWGGCPILETDIRVKNGFIHVLGGVVVPVQEGT